MSKKVEIYSKSNCSYCVMAMNFFESKNVDYEVYSTDDPCLLYTSPSPRDS